MDPPKTWGSREDVTAFLGPRAVAGGCSTTHVCLVVAEKDAIVYGKYRLVQERNLDMVYGDGGVEAGPTSYMHAACRIRDADCYTRLRRKE